jgi:hypothetical protein
MKIIFTAWGRHANRCRASRRQVTSLNGPDERSSRIDVRLVDRHSWRFYCREELHTRYPGCGIVHRRPTSLPHGEVSILLSRTRFRSDKMRRYSFLSFRQILYDYPAIPFTRAFLNHVQRVTESHSLAAQRPDHHLCIWFRIRTCRPLRHVTEPRASAPLSAVSGRDRAR